MDKVAGRRPAEARLEMTFRIAFTRINAAENDKVAARPPAARLAMASCIAFTRKNVGENEALPYMLQALVLNSSSSSLPLSPPVPDPALKI